MPESSIKQPGHDTGGRGTLAFQRPLYDGLDVVESRGVRIVVVVVGEED